MKYSNNHQLKTLKTVNSLLVNVIDLDTVSMDSPILFISPVGHLPQLHIE